MTGEKAFAMAFDDDVHDWALRLLLLLCFTVAGCGPGEASYEGKRASHWLEDIHHRDGWCRWSTSEADPWEWRDYKPMVTAGLLEKRDRNSDVLLKLTDKGWRELQSSP